MGPATSFKLWRVHTLSKKASLPSYAMERGSGHLGSSSTLLAFKWQAEAKKVTRKGKFGFFLKSRDRFCWPPHRIEVSPKCPPPVCTPSAVCHRDPATQTPVQHQVLWEVSLYKTFSTLFLDFSLHVTLTQLPSPYNWFEKPILFSFMGKNNIAIKKIRKKKEINQTQLINKCTI